MLIYDPDHTNIQDITNDYNSLHPKLKFTTELETNNNLNYLDIAIRGTLTGWQTSIYRQPTFTNSIIPYSSNHPVQHKYAAIRYLYNRLHTFNLHDHERWSVITSTEEKKTPSTTSCSTTHFQFPPPPKNPPHLKKITTPNKPKTTSTQKWATFTYVGKETTFITNLFENTDPKIAMHTNNSIQKILTNRQIRAIRCI